MTRFERFEIQKLAKTILKGQYKKKRYLNVRDEGNHFLVWTNDQTVDGDRVYNQVCSILK